MRKGVAGHLVFARRMLKTLSANICRSVADGNGLRRLTEGTRNMFQGVK